MPLGPMIREVWYDYSEVSKWGGDKVGEVGKPEIMQGLLGHIKKIGFHYKSNQEALKAFK